ncbi:SH3 domain-containing protein [Acinetobacter seifertii]|uniref:SH3 domain-containing protein n=1 Tax=Acinetobacter seifertii TaxID=1530123 RepID=UPI00168B8CAB|nr:SH3 domain-containing protein [Acinetobacter seifertii]QNX87808.1 SH3 domain-containing protein [Acinetobacter seifertii]
MSTPLNESKGFTLNPELQKSLQTIAQVLINFQNGLISFLQRPDVQEALKAIHNIAAQFHQYLNDPNVQKNIVQLQRNIVSLVDSHSFQKEYLNNKYAESTNDFTVFEKNIREEINFSEQLSSFPSEEEKNKFFNFFLHFIFLVFMFHISNLDKFTDFKESYIFYINNIDSKGVTISRINLREEPSFESEPILVLPRNTVLKVYQETNNGWVKVSVNQNNLDIEGYVSKVYIKKIKSEYDFNAIFNLKDD